MKEFVVYTLGRLGVFVVTYLVFASVWSLVADWNYLWPFVAAILVSSLISLKVLGPQRAALAQRIDNRATAMRGRFDDKRAREDYDDE